MTLYTTDQTEKKTSPLLFVGHAGVHSKRQSEASPMDAHDSETAPV